MKRIAKMMAVFAAAIMATMALAVTAWAVPNNHTITIENTDQNVSHSYEAYQVFSGDLDAAEQKLSNIAWGNGVDAAKLVKALQETNDTGLASLKTAVAEVDTTDSDAVAAAALTVAKEVAKFTSTSGANESAGAIDAFATIVADNLATKAANFTEGAGENAKKYTANVTGDGYYFVKDTTSTLKGTNGSDTLSKYLLSVIKDTTIVAKDTVIAPNKTVTDAKVKANSAAIGDLVTFYVEVPVPNTKKYEKNFWFFMEDQLPAGLTFNEVVEVKAGSNFTFTTAQYDVTAKTGAGEYAAYTKPASKEAAVAATGGQKVKVVFKNFKSVVETNNLIGETMTIKYTAYVNDDAAYGETGNKNEVEFTYSTDPNHDYVGDEPDNNSTDPTGKSPKSETTTYVTSLEILKVDGTNSNAALEGAEFEISGTAYNMTVVTAEEYTKDNENGTYWLLKDGSYTTQNPNDEGMNKTQYAEPITQKYKKETVDKVVTTPTDSKITAISDENGKITVGGLKPGTYTVKETKAPDGYNKITDTYTLVVKWDLATALNTANKTGGFSLGDGSTPATNGWTMTTDGAVYKIQIQNNQGTALPSTGGMGTTILYIIGGILVVGAVIFLVTKKRAANARKSDEL